MYDLDKTQEWLNRTQQIGRTPALRGGVAPDYRARRDTALSVLFALIVVLFGSMLFTRLRPPVLGSSSSGRLLTSPGSARVGDESAGPFVTSASYPPLRFAAPPVTPPPSRLGFDAPDVSLDGGIVPLPGHVAPSAPIWLDGVPH